MITNVEFLIAFKNIQERAHRINVENGFWDKAREFGTLVSLAHSELSEMVEADRHGNPPDDKIPQFTGLEAEAADTIIRIMDMAEAYGWNLPQAILAKLEYNSTRGHMHGGKKY